MPAPKCPGQTFQCIILMSVLDKQVIGSKLSGEVVAETPFLHRIPNHGTGRIGECLIFKGMEGGREEREKRFKSLDVEKRFTSQTEKITLD